MLGGGRSPQNETKQNKANKKIAIHDKIINPSNLPVAPTQKESGGIEMHLHPS